MLALQTTRGLEGRSTSLVFQNPFFGELAGLDFAKDLLHLLLRLGSDDPRSAGVVTELGGIGDAITHVVQTSLIEQIDDEL